MAHRHSMLLAKLLFAGNRKQRYTLYEDIDGFPFHSPEKKIILELPMKFLEVSKISSENTKTTMPTKQALKKLQRFNSQFI